jgi:hypothetical protein
MSQSPTSDTRRSRLRRALTNSETLKSELAREVCAEYPGGPAGYRYVPERCVRATSTASKSTPRRGAQAAAQVQRPARSARKDVDSLRRIEKALDDMKDTVRDVPESLHVPDAPRGIVPKHILKHKVAYSAEYKLLHQPVFLVHALDRFLQLAATTDDVERRWTAVCREYKPLNFERDNNMKQALLMLVKQSITRSPAAGGR